MQLIDKEKLLEAIDEIPCGECDGPGLDECYSCVVGRVRIAPVVDAVEVVRCNECLNSYKCCDGTLRCDNSYGPDNMDREVSASWFCANGERKDLSLGIKTIDKEEVKE